MLDNINLLNYSFIENIFIKANEKASLNFFDEEYEDIFVLLKKWIKLKSNQKYNFINYINDYINNYWWEIDRIELFRFFEETWLLYKEFSINEDEINIYIILINNLKEEIENFIFSKL